jgi:phage terminase Nu1 subunit (DNA packaging protein)
VTESVNAVELASLFGITDRAVRALGREGLPRNPDGSYPLGPAIRWYVARKTAPTALLEARTRKETAAAKKAELELARMCKELMTVQGYERVVNESFMRVAGKLNALPNRAASRMLGITTLEEALRRLQAEVDEVRAELYDTSDIPEAA